MLFKSINEESKEKENIYLKFIITLISDVNLIHCKFTRYVDDYTSLLSLETVGYYRKIARKLHPTIVGCK